MWWAAPALPEEEGHTLAPTHTQNEPQWTRPQTLGPQAAPFSVPEDLQAQAHLPDGTSPSSKNIPGLTHKDRNPSLLTPTPDRLFLHPHSFWWP